jgi:GAF domain-containing protein
VTAMGDAADRQQMVVSVLRRLESATECFVAGLLLANCRCGEITLSCARPVDDIFLQAVQQRLVRSYQLSAGRAVAEPEFEVTVLGESLSGPYEPPRSVLTMPVLLEGRVCGMIIIASVFPEVFGNQDLCELSAVAAVVSEALGKTHLPG